MADTSTASTDQTAFSGKFMFVGNVANDAKSGKQIRSHLMREYYRKERWKKCQTHRQAKGDNDRSKKDARLDDIAANPKKKVTQVIRAGVSKTTKELQSTSAAPGRGASDIGSVGLPSASRIRSNSSLPPLIIPSPRTSASIVLPYVATSATTPASPELLPEPLFCPPLPKKSNDLSSGIEMAFSMYTPEGAPNFAALVNLEERTAKAKSRKSIRLLVEEFYIKRPSLCGSPGSEIFVGPFGYLPIKLNATDHAVLQYYPRVPELVYNVEPTNRYAVHKTVFLPIAFLYPESLYMCLASSNTYMTHRYGIKDHTLTDFYKHKAYARIQENMNKAESRYADSVVAGLSGSAVIALGASPDHGNLVEFMTHMMGLNQVMRMRGGHQSMRDNPRLDMAYCAILLIIGKTWSDCLGKIIPPTLNEYAMADVTDFVKDVKHFTSWLRQSSAWVKNISASGAAHYTTTPKQADVFSPEKALYKVLDWPLAMNEASPKRVMFERSHHTFSVIYLALAMFELRDQSVEAKDTFLDTLTESLKYNDISKAYSCVSLGWMLIQIYNDQPERVWSALSLSRAAWKLTIESFDRLKTHLLWLLNPTIVDDEIQPMDEDFIQELEMEALQGLPHV